MSKSKVPLLNPVSSVIETEILSGKGRSEAMHSVASDLDVTVATLYRWVKDENHYVCDEHGFRCVYKLVKLAVSHGQTK